MKHRVSITKLFTFEASHLLPNHMGKCRNNHGHSYKLEVTVTGQIQHSGHEEGMVMDFSDVSHVVKTQIIDNWDHHFLNDLVPFTPTVENLALEAFERITKAGLNVTHVRLWETGTCYAAVEIANG